MSSYKMNISATVEEEEGDGWRITLAMDDSEGLILAKRVKGQDFEKCIDQMYTSVVKDMVKNKFSKAKTKECTCEQCQKDAHQESEKDISSRVSFDKYFDFFNLF
jgi:hypothetical protein